jgi:hypothetical protein
MPARRRTGEASSLDGWGSAGGLAAPVEAGVFRPREVEKKKSERRDRLPAHCQFDAFRGEMPLAV